jgi:hypothetical protein
MLIDWFGHFVLWFFFSKFPYEKYLDILRFVLLEPVRLSSGPEDCFKPFDNGLFICDDITLMDNVNRLLMYHSK